jgi:uncharacterized protein YfaP (DUF2135 family)
MVDSSTLISVWGSNGTSTTGAPAPPTISQDAAPTTGNYRLNSKYFGSVTESGVTYAWEQGTGW